MLTGFLSVNQNDSLLIHTLKEQLYHFALGSGKPLAILTFTARIPTSIGTAGTSCRIRGIGYCPIVR